MAEEICFWCNEVMNELSFHKKLGGSEPAAKHRQALRISLKCDSADEVDQAGDRCDGRLSKSSEAIARDRQRWLISPLFDLMFVCGAAPWILGFVTYLILGSDISAIKASPAQQALSIFLVTASLLIGESHQFTSIIRYYDLGRKQKKSYKLHRFPFWFLYAVAALIIVALAAQAMGWGALLNPVISPIGVALVPVFSTAMSFFPVVLMHHFCAQAQAVGQIYCGKQGYKLSKLEKVCLSISSWSLVAAGASTIAAPFGSGGMLSSVGASQLMAAGSALGGPGTLAQLAVSFACLAILGTTYLFIKRGMMKSEWLPSGAVYLWINLATLILLPLPGLIYMWLFVPIFLHASQHWTVAYLAQQDDLKKQGREPQSSFAEFAGDICKLVLPVQALSLCVLFLPLIVAQMLGEFSEGLSSTLSVGWSMLVFYLHYFSDRIVWRP